MTRRVARVTLPWPVEKVFDLVADVERYPEFLPWCSQARVTRRDGDIVWVKHVARLGLLRVKFKTVATLRRPSRIVVTRDGSGVPWFRVDWRFQPTAQGGSLVAVEFSSDLVALPFMARGGGVIARRIIAAFERKAREVFTPRRPTPQCIATPTANSTA